MTLSPGRVMRDVVRSTGWSATVAPANPGNGKEHHVGEPSTTQSRDDTAITVALSKLDAVKDAMSIRRAFGDAYDADGVRVIPVAVVRGGAGGGGGGGTQGTGPDTGEGSGAGVGFAVNVRPLGVYVVKDGTVTWSPAIDVLRIVIGGQLLGLVGILAIRRLLAHRSCGRGRR